ncbi:RagB/SusD family nutrient uptake outer membrane protein [Maribellus maritimus]|uniref:RagB/SusD family nutrient uptake outer membrane protein n=1 Tax=Maribellus maritimus TaxID=2870838 RepID=UPI001EEBB563|nr:RagB/SusD family nutrient uptake outer membrane protein [Maribellus maritimus]MCG6190521.1 RagB/SusD family nutrient uptake outer membrane protein [Maribellus maritimus]
MKKIFKYTLITFLALLAISCNDEWLTPKPLSIFVPESIYIDKAGMDAVLLTMRKNLRHDFYGAANELTNELITSDLCVAGNKQTSATHNFFTQVMPTGTGQYNFFTHWDVGYNQIRNANVVISRIDAPEWSSEQDKNEILAEAYFHRAYWYYRLVHQFGDVPFLNKEYTEPKIDFYTHSRKTILNKIQSDMEFAVQWLPEAVDPGKVNRAAGNHLLAKVYLANSDFDGAISAASAAIDDGIHSLMTNRFGKYAGDDKYNIIWDLHQKENKSLAENKEALLVCQDKYGYPDAEAGGGTTSMRNYAPLWWHRIYLKDADGKAACTDARGDQQVIKWGRGVGYARPSNYVNYEVWENCQTDLRHDTVVNWMPMEKLLHNNPESAYYGQPVTKDYTNPIDTFQSWFPWPYYKIYIEDEERPDQPYGGHSDWYVFRLAETYLLRAEAYVWKGDMASAASDINKIRERALAPPVESSDVSIEYILDERARELYTEEPRKCELTRIAFIMADNNMNGYSIDSFDQDNYWFDRVQDKNNFYNVGYTWGSNEFKIGAFHVLWPVPQDVIDDNQGGTINQNTGYPGVENNIPPKTEITEED